VRIRSFIAWLAEPGITWTGDAGWREWSSRTLQLRWFPRVPASGAEADNEPHLILGDDAEVAAFGSAANLAAGVPITIHEASGALVCHTSVVALPPVFIYRGPSTIALTSDIHLLRGLSGASLGFDARAVTELGRYGHPVGRRTLFSDVELAPAGHRLTLDPLAGLTIERTWALPQAAPLEWPEFLEAQASAFEAALQQMDARGSVLSLTAGLDTRTVFAALARQGRLIPAVTMTGARRSLDARIAARLCAAYGAGHEAVVFDRSFESSLPDLLEEASLLSGGVESLSQAPEVFLYRKLAGRYRARLSGNLGNQVGRGGTEGVSVRQADLAILGEAFRDGARATDHWLLRGLAGDRHRAMEFVLENEIAHTLVGNYCIGSHHAVQQTPYASRQLIEILASSPARGGSRPGGSKLRMRLRDLRHRFLGESAAHSFQRTLVAKWSGYAARCPVNWGWLPTGGISPTGALYGIATFAGMFARARGLDAGALRALMDWSGLPALHDFRESRRWLRHALQHYVHDTVMSAANRNPGLFNIPVLDSVLRDHLSGRRDRYDTVVFALDLSLATRFFSGRAAR
jgi:hypothetical protein